MKCLKCGKEIEQCECRSCGFDIRSQEFSGILEMNSESKTVISDLIKSNQAPKYSNENIDHDGTTENKATVLSQEIAAKITARLVAEEKDRHIANGVISAIDAIVPVSDSDEAGQQIRSARRAYSNLTLAQRSLVYNESKLRTAEAEYAGLRKKAEEQHAKRIRKRILAIVGSACAIFVVSLMLFKTGVLFPKRALSDAFFSSAKQGDEFVLGRYEQDNNLDNGAEDIEWVVVKNDDGLVLAVSKYCLDNKPFNESDSYTSVDWEHCSLRQWLNEDFYNASFTDDEKTWICATNLQNHDAEFYCLPGGNNTVDHVFLLSCGDITANYDDYCFGLMSFSRDDILMMVLTSSNQDEYDLLRTTQTRYAKEKYIKAQTESLKWMNEDEARAQYAELEEEYGANASDWWLRTRGDKCYTTMTITWSGSSLANPSQSTAVGVRPAILISKNRDQAKDDKAAGSNTSENSTPLSNEGVKDQEKVKYPIQMVYGDQHIGFVTEDGDVIQSDFHGGNDFSEWSASNIKKIAVSEDTVVGLTDEGTVLISPSETNRYGVDSLPLTNIVDVCICSEAVNPEDDSYKGCIICLSGDGDAYFSFAGGCGRHSDNVRAISATGNKYAIVYNDGTVDGQKFDDEIYSEVPEWSGIVQVACGDTFVAGLKSDGSVVVSGGFLPTALEGSKILLYEEDDWTGFNSVKFDLSGWKDIVSISAGAHHLVGLKKDGTVVSAGLDTYGQCDTADWEDVVKIDTGKNVTIGYAADGDYYLTGKDILPNILDLEDTFDAWIGYTW